MCCSHLTWIALRGHGRAGSACSRTINKSLQLIEAQGWESRLSRQRPETCWSTWARRSRTNRRSMEVSSPSALHFKQVRPRQSAATGAVAPGAVATGAVATGVAGLGVWITSFKADLRVGVEISFLCRGPKSMPPNREYCRPVGRFPGGSGHRDRSDRPGRCRAEAAASDPAPAPARRG